MPTRLAMAIMALGLMVPASAALADARSYCVSCAGPDQVYECRIDAGDSHPDDATLLLHCIGELARRHGHASCKTRRTQITPCPGLPQELVYSGLPVPVADAPVVVATPQAAASATVEPVAETPPKTLVELTGKTVKSMDESVQKTGDSIGKAAASTWTCITSLFADCN